MLALASRVLGHIGRRPYSAFAVQQREIPSSTSSVAPNRSKKAKKLKPSKPLRKRETIVAKRRPLLPPSAVDAHLQKIKALSQGPTLEDLERLRPETIPPSESAQYVATYKFTIKSLRQAFTRAQLSKMARSLGFSIKSTATQLEIASIILEQAWRMQDPVEVARAHRHRTHVEMRPISVTPSQLFLLMEGDGRGILDLSRQFKLRLAVKPSPLSLEVEGTGAKIDEMSTHLDVLKNAYITETFNEPSWKSIDQYVLQRVSRLTGAFVESASDDTFIISAKNSETSASARRLLTLTAYNQASLNRSGLLASTNATISPLVPPSYALYPFLPSQVTPWKLGKDRLFRMKQVGDFLLPKIQVDQPWNEITYRMDGSPIDLRKALFSGQTTSGKNRRLIASFGHIVFPSTSASSRTITPPLGGKKSFQQLLASLGLLKGKITFIPSLPPSLLKPTSSQLPSSHRLIYHSTAVTDSIDRPRLAGPQSLKVIEFTLPVPVESTSPWAAVWLDDFTPLPKAQTPSEALNSQQGLQGRGNSHLAEADVNFSSECQAGMEQLVDVLMPDQSMDLRFSLRDLETLPLNQVPPQLQAYSQECSMPSGNRPPPPPPLQIDFNGDQYVLVSNHAVRSKSDTTIASLDDQGSRRTVEVTIETIVDLETKEKFTTCQVIYEEKEKEKEKEKERGWARFFSNLKRLTSKKFNLATTSVDSTAIL